MSEGQQSAVHRLTFSEVFGYSGGITQVLGLVAMYFVAVEAVTVVAFGGLLVTAGVIINEF